MRIRFFGQVHLLIHWDSSIQKGDGDGGGGGRPRRLLFFFTIALNPLKYSDSTSLVVQSMRVLVDGFGAIQSPQQPCCAAWTLVVLLQRILLRGVALDAFISCSISSRVALARIGFLLDCFFLLFSCVFVRFARTSSLFGMLIV